MDITNLAIKGTGQMIREELEEELEKMLIAQGSNKEKTKLTI